MYMYIAMLYYEKLWGANVSGWEKKMRKNKKNNTYIKRQQLVIKAD